MKKLILIVAVTAFLCATAQVSCRAENAKDKTDAKGASSAEKSDSSYKICSGDVIRIDVYQEVDLSGDFEVKEGGAIAYPLLGTVKVAGLTKNEAEKKLNEMLKDGYMVDPFVKVSVSKFSGKNVLGMVLGCVQKRGYINFPADGTKPTLLKAIVSCGGFTSYADPGGTRIIRTDKSGKKITIRPGMNDIINGRKNDVDLEPGDLIIVPERLF